ncbi:MAG: hypothetical protein ACKPKO_31060 [Candidatus Fonsibacter sp.]
MYIVPRYSILRSNQICADYWSCYLVKELLDMLCCKGIIGVVFW